MRDSFDLINAKFLVLLALAGGPKHGLAIQQQIIGDTVGQYVRTSTVYAVVRALTRDGMVEPTGAGDAVGVSHYRKEYQLTERGRRALKLTAQTMKYAAERALKT
jgi:DNA-binding PadR family transcriptional regulator